MVMANNATTTITDGMSDTITINVDKTEYRIEIEQDTFGFAWELSSLLSQARSGVEPTRREALAAAMALIDLGETEMDVALVEIGKLLYPY